MGLATEMETAIDGLLNTFILSKSAALCSALIPLAITGVTIYIITMGWAIMRGDTNDSFHTALWKFFKITIIGAVALGGGAYQSVIVSFIQGIPGVFFDAFGGTSTMGGTIDNMGAPFTALGSALIDKGTKLVPSIYLIIAGLAVFAAEAVLFVVGLGLFLLTKVSLALILAVGPVFVLCAMFPATQRFTESWIGQALNYVLMNALIGISFSMLTSFAKQYAASILASMGSSPVVFSDIAALVSVSLTLAVVLLNLNSIASALAGGASIGGIGRDIARAAPAAAGAVGSAAGAAGRGIKSLRDKLKGAGNSVQEASSQSGRSSVPNYGGSGMQALYQQNTLSNIRKAA
jgi:type IV secretion system protein VirB6